MRLVGVVPSAGHGTRLRASGLWRGSKEVMPVWGRPVVEHLLERLAEAGCDEVRVVTRPEKGDLRELLARHTVRVVLGTPADVSASLLLGCKGLDPDDVVLSGFPDTLWCSGGLSPLVELLRQPCTDVALGLFRLPDLRGADQVLLDEDGAVRRVFPKPVDPGAGTTWGCFAARCHVLAGLAQVSEPGLLWSRLADTRRGCVQAVVLGDGYVDVGTAMGLRRATTLKGPRAAHPGDTVS